MFRKTAAEAALARPFARDVWSRAAAIADRYRLVLEPDKDLGFIGSALEMPGVMADGRTPDACVRAVRQALTASVATLLERGRTPPAPLGGARRTSQVNIRLTGEEKLLLEAAARREGFRGVSDYVRTTTLAKLR